MTRRIISIILVFQFFIPFGLLCEEPSSAEVIEELNKILEKMGKKQAPKKIDSEAADKFFSGLFKSLLKIIEGIVWFFTTFGPLVIIAVVCARSDSGINGIKSPSTSSRVHPKTFVKDGLIYFVFPARSQTAIASAED